MKKYLIIDTLNLFFRSYYAIKPMQTSFGSSVNGVYGFFKILLKLINDYSPDYIYVVWDSKLNLRKNKYPFYKNNRSVLSDDIIFQKDLLQNFFGISDLPLVLIDGYEADDLIAHLVDQLANNQNLIYIVSGDKDLHALLDENIFIIDSKNELLNRDKLATIYSFVPTKEQIYLYYALVGDAIDGISGVKGIGKKAAEKIIVSNQSLDDLYQHYEQDNKLSPRLKHLLKEGQSDAYISYELVKPLCFDGDITGLCIKNESNFKEKLYKFFHMYEFFSLLPKDYTLTVVQNNCKRAIDEVEIFIVNEENIEIIFTQILNNDVIALDTETTGGHKKNTSLVGISIAITPGKAYYFPVLHKDGKNISFAKMKHFFDQLFEDSSRTIVMHHALFDLHILKNYGFTFSAKIFDTLIAASLVRKSDDERLGLKELSSNWLKKSMESYFDVIQECEVKTFAEVPIIRASRYAAIDAHQTLLLHELVTRKMRENGTEKLFFLVEMPVLKILFDIESRGILVDQVRLAEQATIINQLMEDLHKAFMAMVGPMGESVNLSSPQQIGKLLFDDLGLPAVRKTAQGNVSTDQETLEVLARRYPIASLIHEYRTLASIRARCIDGLKKYISTEGYIHTSFNQAHVITGRLSTSDPNMQNIPTIRQPYSIRSAFIARPGYLLLSIDYSQIELRVLASLARDEKMIQAFLSGTDIHKQTAAAIAGVEPCDVTPEMRQHAKKINFGIVYGLSAYGLAQSLGISSSKAHQYIESYKVAYPDVFKWIDKVFEEAQRDGYVKTLHGRIRFVKANDKNKHVQAEAKRIAINTIVQGTAAEIMKLAMIECGNLIKSDLLDVHMILQIHDELLFEVPVVRAKEMKDKLVCCFEGIALPYVPLHVTANLGMSWAEV